MKHILSSGSDALDFLLEGGYEKGIITTLYGPASSGKTCSCMLAAINAVREGRKVVFIDSEGGFSVERFKQITSDYENILKGILFLRPMNFIQQKEVFEKLKNIINEKIGLVIVDTISMLYRLELASAENAYDVNNELVQQISFLSEIARDKNIPVLVTNQVYADFEDKTKVNMVGGDIMKYGSKCLIELRKDNFGRKAVLQKHRSIKEGKEICFEIKNEGIVKTILL